MPSCLKIGKQTPIFKGGDNVLANYRPITVVTSIAKIFEKSVCSRLLNFLERFDILTDNQFGFRCRHATSHAMIKLFDEALSALNDRQPKREPYFSIFLKRLITLIMISFSTSYIIMESGDLY